MSQNTDRADELIGLVQDKAEAIELSGIQECVKTLADACSEIISATQAVESDINDLEGAIGEDPGIQISELKDQIRDLERRLERLERDKE